MTVDIDARGLQCPWPALRLARAMRTQDRATIVADDPVAPREIGELANQCGWSFGPVETEIGAGFLVVKRTPVSKSQ